MSGKPIPVSQANDMATQYADYVRSLQEPPDKKTQYVSFTFSDLMTYLKQVDPFSDELRVVMGISTSESPDPGRVTVILWPYKDGQPAKGLFTEGKDGGDDEELPPYDDGQSGP